MSGMCKPTVGAMGRLMRVVRCCNMNPALSLSSAILQQKLVDADHASDETTRKSTSFSPYTWDIASSRLSARQATVSLSSGEPENHVSQKNSLLKT